MLGVRRVVRCLADTPKFADRWGTQPVQPEFTLPPIPELPKHPVSLPPNFRAVKDRIFDLDLPIPFRPTNTSLQIWAIGDGMFSVNGVWLPGSLMVFKDAVFQWNVQHPGHIQDYHFDILRFLRPKLEYIIIGTGKKGQNVLSQMTLKRYQSIGLAIDTCGTVLCR